MFQGYGLARYKKCKTNIAILKECGPSKKQENKRGTWRGTLIHALEKRLREREREDCFGGARPPNLLNIALCGLAPFCLHPFPFCSHLGGRTLTLYAKTKETSQQTSKETNGRKSMLKKS